MFCLVVFDFLVFDVCCVLVVVGLFVSDYVVLLVVFTVRVVWLYCLIVCWLAFVDLLEGMVIVCYNSCFYLDVAWDGACWWILFVFDLVLIALILFVYLLLRSFVEFCCGWKFNYCMGVCCCFVFVVFLCEWWVWFVVSWLLLKLVCICLLLGVFVLCIYVVWVFGFKFLFCGFCALWVLFLLVALVVGLL